MQSSCRAWCGHPGATLRVLGGDLAPLDDVVFSTGPDTSGNSFFAHDDLTAEEGEEMALWGIDYRLLRIDFAGTVETVSIDYIGRGLGDIGRLMAFDVNDNVVGSIYYTGELANGQRETMTVAEPGIAYAIAAAVGSQHGFLDSLSFAGAAETSTVTDGNGEYAFTGLSAGYYTVLQAVPDGYQQTFPYAGPQRLLGTVINGRGFSDIVEIDPASGAVVNRFPVAGFHSSTTNGLAFDGHILFVLSSDGVLYEVDPDDGTILDTMQLPGGRWDGLAALGGLIYANEPFSSTIRAIDPTTNSVVHLIDFGPGLNLRPFGGLGEFISGDGTASLLGSVGSSNGISVLDPETGAVRDTLFHATVTDGRDFGLAGMVERRKIS